MVTIFLQKTDADYSKKIASEDEAEYQYCFYWYKNSITFNKSVLVLKNAGFAFIRISHKKQNTKLNKLLKAVTV